MPLPDPHSEEPTVPVDQHLFNLWRKAASYADAWQVEADKLKAELIQSLGDAYAGMIGDQKVITYRPSEKWAESRLKKDYPDLTEHFTHMVARPVFDIQGFRVQHPDIAAKYQVRSFREVES